MKKRELLIAYICDAKTMCRAPKTTSKKYLSSMSYCGLHVPSWYMVKEDFIPKPGKDDVKHKERQTNKFNITLAEISGDTDEASQSRQGANFKPGEPKARDGSNLNVPLFFRRR